MRKERESGFAGWFRGTVHGVSGFPPYQAVLAIEWLWSFRRLWVAAISRHSDRAAARPLRWKRSNLRLCLICPNTGSMLCRAFRVELAARSVASTRRMNA